MIELAKVKYPTVAAFGLLILAVAIGLLAATPASAHENPCLERLPIYGLESAFDELYCLEPREDDNERHRIPLPRPVPLPCLASPDQAGSCTPDPWRCSSQVLLETSR